MPTSQVIAPTAGHAPSIIDGGPGAPGEGYSGVDWRRIIGAQLREGILSDGSYAVTAAAGTRQVSVAAAGDGLVITNDMQAAGGKYLVAPHSAAFTLDHDAADATNPRNDLIVAKVYDSRSDGGGSDLVKVEILKGAPTPGAAKTDAFGANGTPALPSSAFPLAVVNVPAGFAGAFTTATHIDDRRYRTSGKSMVATEESRTAAAYGLLATPDRVRNIVLPTDGLIVVAYQAQWYETVDSAARAAIFIGANQLRGQQVNVGPVAQEAEPVGGANILQPLASSPRGLNSRSGAAATSVTLDVTSGQVVAYDISGDYGGGPAHIFAAAGIYDVSVQFKVSSGGVFVSSRKLWVWTQSFPG